MKSYRKLIITFTFVFISSWVYHSSVLYAEETSQSLSQTWTYEQIQQELKSLQDQEDYPAAISFLKEQIANFPQDDRTVNLLKLDLALAYYAMGNSFWAIRTLQSITEESNIYPEALSLMAWIHISGGNFTEGEYLLENPVFSQNQWYEHRRVLYQAYIDDHERYDKPDYVPPDVIDSVFYEIFKEDEALFYYLVDHDYILRYPLFSLYAEAGGGFSNNPGLAYQLHEGTNMENAEYFWQGKLKVDLIPLYLRTLHIFGGVVLYKNRFYLQDTFDEEISQLYLSPRIGIDFHWFNGLEIAYHPTLIHLEGGDPYKEGPYWFREAHNMDMTFHINDMISVFLNTGYSLFRHAVRSRISMDGGAFLSFPITHYFHLYLLGGIEWHFTREDVYSLFNIKASPILVFYFDPIRITIKPLLYFDYYYKKTDYYFLEYGLSEEDRRMELSSFNSITFTYTLPYRIGLNITGEFNKVFSNIALFDNYELKVYCYITYEYELNNPEIETQPSELTNRFQYFDYQGSREETLSLEDIIRKEDINRRSSSCISR